MRKTRLLSVVALLTLLMATNVWAKARDPIHIINDANHTWSVKVWAYPGWAKEWLIYSCQTLGYDAAWSRTIDPVEQWNPYAEPFTNHCGNYDSLTFWFQVWNRETGVTRDYSTFGKPTPWGATWRWDGQNWTCTGC